jgi:ketosteroid isomerase-like protein
MDIDTDSIRDAERQRCAAIAAGDMTRLGDWLAEDYVHVFGDGSVGDKASYIESVRTMPRAPERGDLLVRVYGDVAVVTGPLLNHVHFPNRGLVSIDAFATQVLRKGSGQWRFTSFQITPLRRRRE